MSLYRVDAISVVDASRCIAFYFMTDMEAWYWNDYDKRWDEAWHGLMHCQNNKMWVKSPSSPWSFYFLQEKDLHHQMDKTFYKFHGICSMLYYATMNGRVYVCSPYTYETHLIVKFDWRESYIYNSKEEIVSQVENYPESWSEVGPLEILVVCGKVPNEATAWTLQR